MLIKAQELVLAQVQAEVRNLSESFKMFKVFWETNLLELVQVQVQDQEEVNKKILDLVKEL